MLRKFPKIVAVFDYTGGLRPLSDAIEADIMPTIRTEVGVIDERGGNFTETVKLFRNGNGAPNYPAHNQKGLGGPGPAIKEDIQRPGLNDIERLDLLGGQLEILSGYFLKFILVCQ